MKFVICIVLTSAFFELYLIISTCANEIELTLMPNETTFLRNLPKGYKKIKPKFDME